MGHIALWRATHDLPACTILDGVEDNANRWRPICARPSGVVHPVRLDPTGATGPTRGQARSKKWRQSSRGFYVPAHVDPHVPEQRIVEKSVLLPAGGAVTGWGSLRLQHGGFFDGLDRDGITERPVLLVSGPGRSRRRREGVRWLQDRFTEDEVWVRLGVRCLAADRATFDEMRTADDLREAVVAFDKAAAGEITSLRRMWRQVDLRPGWDGVPMVRKALALGSELTRSPNETRMRLVWVLDAHLPPPLVNQPVWSDTGILLGYADLLDPLTGMVGEYDGADHRRARRHAKDVAREERMRRHGLEYFTVTGPDIDNHRLVAHRMISTRERARATAPERRRWTITPPQGWETPPDLDHILDERDARRALHDLWTYGRQSVP